MILLSVKSTIPSNTLLPLPIHTTSATRGGFCVCWGSLIHAIISTFRGSHNVTALKKTLLCSVRMRATACSISSPDSGSNGCGSAANPVRCDAACFNRSNAISTFVVRFRRRCRGRELGRRSCGVQRGCLYSVYMPHFKLSNQRLFDPNYSMRLSKYSDTA
jgi:hypothetical protein